MNTFQKSVIAGLLGLAIGGFIGNRYIYAQEAAPEAPATCAQFTEISKTLESAGVTISEVPKSIVDQLVAEKGMPPKTKEGFKLYRDDLGGKSQFFTVNPDGCIGYVSPIMPSQTLDTFLKVVHA